MRIRTFGLSHFWKGIQTLSFATASGPCLKITRITVQNLAKIPIFFRIISNFISFRNQKENFGKEPR